MFVHKSVSVLEIQTSLLVSEEWHMFNEDSVLLDTELDFQGYIFVMHTIWNRAFSLTWLASMQIYRNKRKRLHIKSSTPAGLVRNTNVTAVSLL